MKNTVDHSSEVANDILKYVIAPLKIKVDTYQVKVGMMPLISNAMFHRENELLENERFQTLITLARTLDDKNINKAIKALKYQLTVKK